MTDRPLPSDDERWSAVARYLSGESDEAESASVRAWLDAEPTRAARFAALGEAIDAFRARAATPADVDVEAALARVHARMDEPVVLPMAARTARVPQVAARRASGAGRWAAAAAIALGAAGTALWTATQHSKAATYATAAGGRDSVTLVDGTHVLLGPDSRLTVAAGYGDGTRDVTLAGEARFSVVHDAAHPFTVHAGDATIRDVGTVFTVRSDAGAGVRVAVTEGSVDVSATAAPVRLAAGDRAAVDAAGAVAAERGALAPEDTAWAGGRLVFADAPLSRVRADLRRWYGVELSVSDAALAARRVTASFAGEPADRVLGVIALAVGADVARRGDTAVFTPAAAR